MSIERISNAVPESRPFARTVLEIRSGFSRTSLCVAEEPMVETIPSPTRARIVSSPAPPTSRSMLARTVTRLSAMSWIPSLATAATLGVVITLGFTLIWTASKTFRPARSMAAARSNPRSMAALSAEISAFTTFATFPPAR
jgi:hypothetical protein